MKLPSIFNDELSYQNAFLDGLRQMLKNSDELGVFILVLANATYDKNIYELFSDDLKAKFTYFEQLFLESNSDDQLGAPDDVIVFKQLMAMGFEHCGLNQVRCENLWSLQFNPLRSLRPARNSQSNVVDVDQPFNENGFNFNKPFLVKEELWQEKIGTKKCRVLYNKFPFSDFHTLLLIESKANKKQWIIEEDIGFLWQFSQSIQALPFLQIAYNSIGAYASINHQHFHLSVNKHAVINHKKWTHNGGSKKYPLECIKADSKEIAWLNINNLQTQNIAFNFIIIGAEIFIVPRLKQGQYEHESWTAGFGWAEIFGSFSVADNASYQSLNNMNIEYELGKLIR